MKKIKAYRLGTNLIWLSILLVILIVSVIAFLKITPSTDIMGDVLITIITAVLAGLIAAIGAIISQYNTYKNQKFLDDIAHLGIKRLHFEKKKALVEAFEKNPGEVVITGYRFLLTAEIAKDIYNAVKEGTKVSAIITPYWSLSYEMLYPQKEFTIKNYYDYLHTIYEGVKKQLGLPEIPTPPQNAQLIKTLEEHYPVIFTYKAQFTDTYRFDDTFITSPYFHIKDGLDNPLHAKDFFTYEVSNPNDHLWHLLKSETAYFQGDPDRSVLDWGKFEQAYQTFQSEDYSLSQATETFSNMLKKPVETQLPLA